MKKKYRVVVGFKWRGRWLEPSDDKDGSEGNTIELLDCEAETLKRAGKIKPFSAEKKTKKGDK